MPDNKRWYRCHRLIKKGYVTNSDYDQIMSLKDRHKGKIGFMLGNGPSVRSEDLELIADKPFVSFACNRIHLAYNDTNFRPNYVLSADEQMIADFGQEITDYNNSCLFISKTRPFISGDFTWFHQKNGRPFKFSKDVTRDVMVGGGTLISAIQIAYHMGIREFYVYGVDHNFKFEKNKDGGHRNAIGEGNHFIKNYRSGKKWQAPVIDLVEEAFSACDVELRKENGYLLNITRGGRLEVLERKNFEDVIS